ncbi:hypothetical protein LBH_1131 [Lactobacillus helveticus H9]|nr:hypothetical protein LBH_1131 [Lactobacillus helveticus H9]
MLQGFIQFLAGITTKWDIVNKRMPLDRPFTSSNNFLG